MNKLASGRFWLTITAGVVFAYVSVRGILTTEAIATILTMVFTNYFNRSDRSVEKSS